MIKIIIFITLAAVANCALLPSNGLLAPRQAFFQPQRIGLIQPQATFQQRYTPPGAEASAQILRSDAAVNPDSFQYAYETSNGISGQQQGSLKQIGQDAAVVSQGQFQWTSPEGAPVQISYIADENGYQPTGSALPTPPPVPAAIQRAIEYLQRVAPQQQTLFKRF